MKNSVEKRLKYCPRIGSILTSDDFKPGYIAVSRMRCRQWDCEHCCIKNADQWRAHLLETLVNGMEGEKWVFITLTAPSWSHKDPLKSLSKLKQAWGKMYDKLRYKNGGRVSYVLVYETHKSGAFHIHSLVNMGDVYDAYNVQIDQSLPRPDRVKAEKRHPFTRWLKEMSIKLKIGYICHSTRIREGDTGKDNARLAVGYVTKYFTKGATELKMPKRWRRLSTSRDIGSPRTKAKKEFRWIVRHFIIPEDVRRIPHYLVSEGRVLDASDFNDDGVYPDHPKNA